MDRKEMFFVCAVWGILLAALSTADNANWQISQIQSGVSVYGHWIDIEKTPGTNQFGIVNYAYKNNSMNLYYNQGNPSSWTTTLVDSFALSGSDERFGFAYNPVTGRPAISYQNNKTLYLASYNGTSWDRQMIANDAYKGSSLAFDRSGNAIVAYSARKDLDDSLNVAYQQNGSWHNKTLQSDFFPLGDPSINVNPGNGVVSIAYSRTFDNLYFAKSDNLADWTIRTVSTQLDFPEHNILAFDPATGDPAIAFSNNLSGPIGVFRNDGNTWSQPVEAVGELWNTFGFAFTPDGRAAIAYVEQLTANSNGVCVMLENENGGFEVFDQYLFGTKLEFDGPADLLWDESGPYIAYKSWNKGIYFAHVIPEPATFSILALGTGAVMMGRKKKIQ
jgi:hypothetical protein